MRQILLFAALAASLALLSGCTLSKTKKDTEDMTDKAAYHKLSAEEAYEMMSSQEVVVVDAPGRNTTAGILKTLSLSPTRASGAKCPRRCRTRRQRC